MPDYNLVLTTTKHVRQDREIPSIYHLAVDNLAGEGIHLAEEGIRPAEGGVHLEAGTHPAEDIRPAGEVGTVPVVVGYTGRVELHSPVAVAGHKSPVAVERHRLEEERHTGQEEGRRRIGLVQWVDWSSHPLCHKRSRWLREEV